MFTNNHRLTTITLIAFICLLPESLFPQDTSSEKHVTFGTVIADSQEINTPQPIDQSLLSREVESLEDSINLHRTIGLIWGALLTAIGFIGWHTIRNQALEKIEANVDSQSTPLFQRVLDKVENKLHDSIDHVEEELLNLSPVVILRYQERYEDALTSVGWDGNWEQFRNKPSVFQRAIIECLANTRVKYKEGSFAAWDAAQQLIKDTENISNLTTLLRTAVHLKKFTEAKEHFDHYKNKIDLSDDIECHQLMLVVYRRLNDLSSALKMVENINHIADTSGDVRKTTVRSNITYVNNYAALLRDLGDFDKAHDFLVHEVKRIIRMERSHLPDGWHRIINTYIANCIDGRRPTEGIQAAFFALRMGYDNTHLHTCIRLATHLRTNDEEGEQRKAILARVESSLPEMPPSPTKSQSQALLKSMSGKTDEAINEISHALSDTGIQARSKYFLECALGYILIESHRIKEAIDLLHKTARDASEFGGEAYFHLARAFAMQGEQHDIEESARWLESAIEMAPKWLVRGRDTEIFKKHEQILKVFSEKAT